MSPWPSRCGITVVYVCKTLVSRCAAHLMALTCCIRVNAARCVDSPLMQDSVCLQASVAPVQVSSSRGSQTLTVHQGPLIRTFRVLSGSWKSCHYARKGHWLGASQLCEVWEAVSDLCFKLRFTHDRDEWELSDLYGDIGCQAQHQWRASTSQRIPILNWRSTANPVLQASQVWPNDANSKSQQIAN
jgi:hypothetical protein